MASNSKDIRLPPVLSEQALRDLVRSAIEVRRHSLVFEAAELWERELCRLPGETGAQEPMAEAVWQPIASLSQLRVAVGGRFQKLRERWVEAGFPLREHRGDRPIKPEITAEAWDGFAGWLHSEGYQARLAMPTDAWLFEIAKH